MGNLAVINIAGLSQLARQEVFNGASALERIMDWAAAIPSYAATVFLASTGDVLPDGVKILGNKDEDLPESRLLALQQNLWTEESLIRALIRIARIPISGLKDSPLIPEALFFVRGDSPLMDIDVSDTLWKLHYRYDAEYTFADGYPFGLAPEILSAGLPAKLAPLAKGREGAVVRDSLFEILRQDINAFDVETHLSPEDLRMDRVSITCDTARNIAIAEKLYAIGGRDAESLCRLIPESRKLCRSLPAYFPIQVSNHHPQACSYIPRFGDIDPREGRDFMDSDRFDNLCRKIIDFAGDAVFDLSLRGEPASHPEIGTLIRTAIKAGESGNEPGRSKVVLETSGIGWDSSLLESLASEFSDGRLMWILTLDASDPQLYESLRGEGLAEAEVTALNLVRLFGKHCWIQAVRMNENEDHLELFYKKWKDAGAQVIVQKYDSYAGVLPERQPSDLSPLNRIPCWHLKRDMPVLLDGTVLLCKVDLAGDKPLGNAFVDELETLWSGGENLHLMHVEGEYPGICGKCDEYYTFNF